MKKWNIKLMIVIVFLLFAFIISPTSTLASTEIMVKDKINKLILSDTVYENPRYIEESSDDKSLTYTIEVTKGTLVIQLFDFTNFKIEIYNSKNDLVKRIKAVETFGPEGAHIARGGVKLSKGKYKIKILPVDKKSVLNPNGTVSMIGNAKSKTIDLLKTYHIAVKKGETYTIKFSVEKESLFSFQNSIISYDPNEFLPHPQKVKVKNSNEKTVKSFTENNHGDYVTLKKGTYTMTFKASITGYLSTGVSLGD